MITGAHAMFYSPAADELRAFIRDKLGFAYRDVGEGWLIFDLPAAELGCHPGEGAAHEISLTCDDIHATVAELRQRGVEFTKEVEDVRYGLSTKIKLPGGGEVELYQPAY